MATMNISLPDPMRTWVDAQSREGRFANASDYVRHLIRLDQERRAAVDEIQALIDEGLASGEARAVDRDAFLARMPRGR
jgi:antitoxin ParD1/3/4